jgi:Mlc titration factor MtfA (ptsG expression regulator)
MMFKWPWKVDEESGNAEIPWEKALAIPVLANLSDHEQQQLAQMASRFLQQKRLVALQGLELTPYRALVSRSCFACRFSNWASSG